MNSNFGDKMRAAGKLAAKTLNFAVANAKAGISTSELDKLVNDFIFANGAIPAPLNYKGYPKSTCISVNAVICHGVPDEYVLNNGDAINIDVTVILDGHYGDTSMSLIVGGKDSEMIEVAREARDKAIQILRPGLHTGDIGFFINKLVTRRGYEVVDHIGGHGIGTGFHLSPYIPSVGKKGRGEILQPWTCITVEPLVKRSGVKTHDELIPNSEITEIITLDGSAGAQFEHTVLITDVGYEILTIE
jgi:methionyl aminopeptidase